MSINPTPLPHLHPLHQWAIDQRRIYSESRTEWQESLIDLFEVLAIRSQLQDDQQEKDTEN